MKAQLLNKWILLPIVLLVGVLMGKFLFVNDSQHKHEEIMKEAKHEIWTCSMHPQVRKDKPGQCPICGMDLILLNTTENESSDPDAIVMTPTAAKLASVETIQVSASRGHRELELNGKVKADERKVYTQAAHIPGRIEKLYINFTGETIQNGQTIAMIYSPELINAQQELLEAGKIKSMQPTLYQAAKEKLKNWKLSDKQIAEIESSCKIKDQFEIKADVSGLVLTKNINLGNYVMTGSALFEVADLSRIWVEFDAYESDLSSIHLGGEITFQVESIPDKKFTGKVSFIDPLVNPDTRTTSVRVEIDNKGLLLKPEMFVIGKLSSSKSSDAKIVIPKTAVLWTGERSVVYVKEKDSDQPAYKMRNVKLGSATSQGYEILDGLNSNDEVVVNGVFAVDASAQLAGKPSMMNNQESNSGNTLQSQLSSLVDVYIKLKDAFVASDTKKVSGLSAELLTEINHVDMKLFSGDDHMKWMIFMTKASELLKTISHSKDLDEQRKTFALLSESLHEVLIQLKIKGLHAFYQFCPMAGEKGSYWISRTSKIQNPYFGEQMLTCGETKETMN